MAPRCYTVLIMSDGAGPVRRLHLTPRRLGAVLLLVTLATLASGFVVYQNTTTRLKASELSRLRRTVQTEDSLLGAKIVAMEKALDRLDDFDRRVRHWADVEPSEGEATVAVGGGTLDLHKALKDGEIQAHEVTIPEGASVRHIAWLLAKEGLVDRKRFLKLAMDPTVASSYIPEAKTLEGFLFPDTYHFVKGQEEEEIIETMVRRFFKAFPIEDELQALQRGRSLYDIVTLASIVEKEAVIDQEKPIIAGVFYNRLEQGMRLQADPTLLYGRRFYGRHRRGRIRTRDLRARHPYNTYIHAGLPPGPIASPGGAALKAAVDPAQVKYFFFVSKNNGTHYFSRTLKEHNRAVRKFQLRRGVRRGRPSSRSTRRKG